MSFGSLLKSGVCPHSNHGATPPPAREFCPFSPLHPYVPFPEPFPLQSLFDFFLAPESEAIDCKLNIIYFLVNNDYDLNDVSALIVARALLIRLLEPYFFPRISLYPATDNTFLIAPPAIIPVHSDAGCSIIFADLYLVSILYGIEPFSIFTLTIFFLAAFTAFAIASTTSQDFPVPIPTLPFPSQSTITARKRSCLHPVVTLVTLSIASSSS